MLQGRLFSYQDAQRYRLGVNHHQIPVNAPKCPYHTTHRDGAMRVDNGGKLIRTMHQTVLILMFQRMISFHCSWNAKPHI